MIKKKNDIICLKGMKVCFCVGVCAVYERRHVFVWDPCQIFFPVEKTHSNRGWRSEHERRWSFYSFTQPHSLVFTLTELDTYCTESAVKSHSCHVCEVRTNSDGAEISMRMHKDAHPPPPPVVSLLTSQNNVAELTAHITPLALKKTKCVCVLARPCV